MDGEEGTPTFLTQRRSKKNRQTKTQLIFDEQARKDYLKGFQKRKQERRERAQKDLEDEIKTDLKNLRQKRRDEMKKRHEALGLLDTVENNTKKRTIELKNHTIEIAEISDELVSNNGLSMGHNQANDHDFNEQGEENHDSSSAKKPKSKTPLSKKMSLLQNMKAPSSMKKGRHPKTKQRRSHVKLGKNGGIQTASKKKRIRR
ncbi:unnamed protein product [Adineta ricciae]|uniref:Nucleolar protein 12 n=1 Tax=Adineta ricciae TaxID=249248 RepID=A0A814WKU5_ADIRI|nr:unnamed protein product [Adineta ricciae]CAF1202909.1 unnamed protein product [Adineta ricciae]